MLKLVALPSARESILSPFSGFGKYVVTFYCGIFDLVYHLKSFPLQASNTTHVFGVGMYMGIKLLKSMEVLIYYFT